MKARAAKIVGGLFLFVSGAYGLIIYLDLSSDHLVHRFGDIRSVVEGVWIILLGLNGFFQWWDRKPEDAYWEISPAASGVLVVLMTGLAAAVFLGWHARGWADLTLPAAVAALTLVIAGLVYRFASRFKNQIGEARFLTTDDRQRKG